MSVFGREHARAWRCLSQEKIVAYNLRFPTPTPGHRPPASHNTNKLAVREGTRRPRMTCETRSFLQHSPRGSRRTGRGSRWRPCSCRDSFFAARLQSVPLGDEIGRHLGFDFSAVFRDVPTVRNASRPILSEMAEIEVGQLVRHGHEARGGGMILVIAELIAVLVLWVCGAGQQPNPPGLRVAGIEAREIDILSGDRYHVFVEL